MKKQTKIIIGGIAGAVLGILLLGIIGTLIFRVDAAKAREIALRQTGGGEIISQETESEGLWNEYQYKIVNGDSYYEIEIGGFGNVKGIEQGTGYPR